MTDQPPDGRATEPRDTEPYPAAAGDPHDRTETISYSPTPEQRPEWARSAWLDSASPPVEREAMPAVPPTAPWEANLTASPGAGDPPRVTVEPGPQARPGRGSTSGAGLGQVVAAAALSAVL